MEDAHSRTKQLLILKHSLELVKPLAEVLSKSHAALLVTYGESMQDERFQEILDEIGRIIEPNARVEKDAAKMRTQQLFAIRPGHDGVWGPEG